MKRPDSLTVERAFSVLPTYDINPEWKAKKDAGELPEGILGMCGMLLAVWPEEKLTTEEAQYVLWLSEQGSMRWLADEIFDDSNQIFGNDIIEAARRALGSAMLSDHSSEVEHFPDKEGAEGSIPSGRTEREDWLETL